MVYYYYCFPFIVIFITTTIIKCIVVTKLIITNIFEVKLDRGFMRVMKIIIISPSLIIIVTIIINIIIKDLVNIRALT
jgi:hypothetical protein